MAIENKVIQIYQGETKSLIFDIVNKDGSKKNLTNANVVFALIYQGKTKNIKTLSNGIVIKNSSVVVLLDEKDTSINRCQLSYELKIKDSDNNVSIVSIGNIIIAKSNTII